MRKQTIVLRELWISGGKMDIEKLSKETGLNEGEVYWAIVGLRKRGLIKTERKDRIAGYKTPPIGKIYAFMNDKSIKRIKELVKRE